MEINSRCSGSFMPFVLLTLLVHVFKGNEKGDNKDLSIFYF